MLIVPFPLHGYRLQKFRPHKEELVRLHATRGMKIMDMYEDSPNGYEIVSRAPEKLDDAITYYSSQLRTYSLDYPEEYAIIHFNLAKLFIQSIPPDDITDNTAVKLENALFHCGKALDVVKQDSHPIMWAVYCVFLGQVYRRRVQLISNRSVLAKRGSVRDTIKSGMDILNSTHLVFQQAPAYCVEYAVCNQELGFLYLLEFEHALEQDKKKNKVKGENNEEVAPGHIRACRELAVSHFERALSYTEGLPKAKSGHKPRTWDPLDQSTHPSHIRTLLTDESLGYFEGVCIYLTGRSYHDPDEITTLEAYEMECKKRQFARNLLAAQESVDEDDLTPREEELLQELMGDNPLGLKEGKGNQAEIYDPKKEVLDENGDLDKQVFMTPSFEAQEAYKFLVKSLSNRYLPKDSYYFNDAHDRIAVLVLNNPRLVFMDYQKPGVPDNDVHIVSVISHLQACLRSPHSDTSDMQMKLHFRVSQCNIYRVYLVTDRVPVGESISAAFSKSFDATNILLSVEKHLLLARQFVTAANNQSTEEAYSFFYSCLKLAEYKMLYSGIIDDATIEEREKIFQQSVYYILEAINARPPLLCCVTDVPNVDGW